MISTARRAEADVRRAKVIIRVGHDEHLSVVTSDARTMVRGNSAATAGPNLGKDRRTGMESVAF